MARKTAIVWAAEDTADALHARYRAEAVAEVRTRLHALWLLRQGQGPTAVAAVVGGQPQCRTDVVALVPVRRPGRGAVPAAGRAR